MMPPCSVTVLKVMDRPSPAFSALDLVVKQGY
jgi:hypothetical protein